MSRRIAVIAAMVLLALLPAAGAGAVPVVDATAYIVIEPTSGEVLAQRAPDRELPMASTTKIMTALIALEELDLDASVTVSAEAAALGGSTGELVAGERLSVRTLMTALLVASGNDAAIALAEAVAGSEEAFVARMNARAGELGLTATAFANPHGLDAPGHHSSVRDLVTLARVAMRDPFFRETVALARATVPGPNGIGVREYVSRNDLLGGPAGVDGIKTGMTDDAGHALVAHARRAPLGVELYAAVIGAPSEEARARDGGALLDWAFSRFARPILIRPGTVYGHAPIDDRPGVSVPYRVARGLSVPIRLGAPIRETLVAPLELAGPVTAGQVVGSVTLRQGGRVLGRRDLVAARSAAGPGLWDRLRAAVEAVLP